MLNLQCVWSLCRLLAILSAFSNASLRKQTSFGDDTTGFLPCEQRPFDLPRQVDRTLGRSKGLCSQGTGFPAKWRLRNERRNSILNTRHYPDLRSEAYSAWTALVSQTSFDGETSGSVVKMSAVFSGYSNACNLTSFTTYGWHPHCKREGSRQSSIGFWYTRK